MDTWKALGDEFEALASELHHHHIEYQWGGAEDASSLRGLVSSATTRFESIADRAGRKLSQLPSSEVPVEVLMRASGAARWYEALRMLSGAFREGDSVAQRDRRGIPRGALHTGSVADPAAVSAATARAFARFEAEAAGASPVHTARPLEAIGALVVPSVRNSRPWWRSWRAVVGLVGLAVLIIELLPGKGPTATEVPSRFSAPTQTSSPDDSVIVVQPFSPVMGAGSAPAR